MSSFLYQFGTDLRLYYRNKMALLYGYLFPTIFLVAFWVLYRHELVPLVQHMGELLTVTALGGACFGLPTAMVSERERGVWRRYRIAPVSTLQLVLGTLAARYVILISAALLQLILAMWIGMPLPDHLFDLWLAFTFVSFAFLGLGLVIAMLADNVPAVQALGQSIFLPMLIIGGVAVRIQSLPVWAQHVSAFFPGRYSVEAIQVTVNGAGLGDARFSLLALLLVGASGCLAAAKLFRWDARERFVTKSGKAWIGVALAAWIAVGVLAEVTGQVRPTGQRLAEDRTEMPLPTGDGLGDADAAADSGEASRTGAGTLEVGPQGADTSTAESSSDDDDAGGQAEADTDGGGDPRADRPEGGAEAVGAEAEGADERAEVGSPEEPDANTAVTGAEDMPGADAGEVEPSDDAATDEPADQPPPDRPASPEYPETWEEVTIDDVNRDVRFNALPYDEGLEAPIAGLDDPIYPDVEATLDCIRRSLKEWSPAKVDDPVQRARNVLYVAAVPDMYQMSGLESWIPHAVFDYLRGAYPKQQLIKVLYWIATHPDEGSTQAADRLSAVCLNVGGPRDIDMLQQRTGWYAAKLLGRVTGHIQP